MTAAGRDVPRILRPRGDSDSPDPVAHLEPLLAEFAGLPAGCRRDQLRERLVAGFLPVTRELAARYARRGVSEEELVQIAAVGLMKAINRYEYRGYSTFLSYAVPTMQGEIRRHFRDHTWSTHVPRRLKDLYLEIQSAVVDLSPRLRRAPRPSELARVLDVPLEDVLEALQAAAAFHCVSLDRPAVPHQATNVTLGDLMSDPRDPTEEIDTRHTVHALLSTLNDRDRDIVRLRFYAGLSQTQIGERLGMSQMHVSRLLARILSRMRAQMEI